MRFAIFLMCFFIVEGFAAFLPNDLELAVKSGGLDKVRRSLEEGDVDVNDADLEGLTLLHLAARDGSLETVKYLVEKGARINCKGVLEKTPLHFAAESGNLDKVKYLVENGADIHRKNIGQNTALHYATVSGKLETIKYLMEKGAKNEEDVFALTPFLIAVSKGNLETVKYFVEKGAKVDAKNRDKNTPLHFASTKGNLEIVRFLVEKGAYVKVGCQGLRFSALRPNSS